MRPEPAWMRAVRQWDYDVRQLRATDLLALTLGYGVLLAIVVGGAITLFDALDGRPHEVWPQVLAVLEWIDGGVR